MSLDKLPGCAVDIVIAALEARDSDQPLVSTWRTSSLARLKSRARGFSTKKGIPPADGLKLNFAVAGRGHTDKYHIRLGFIIHGDKIRVGLAATGPADKVLSPVQQQIAEARQLDALELYKVLQIARTDPAAANQRIRVCCQWL